MKIRQDKKYNKMEKDTSTKILVSLPSTSENRIESEITKTVSQVDVFNSERNNSDKYRFIFNINPLLTNILTNVTGEKSISSFNENKFKEIVDYRNEGGMSSRSSIGFPESISVNFVEENGWVGFYDIKTLTQDCKLTELLPTKEYFRMDTDTNWVYKLFYCASVDEVDGLEFKLDGYIDYGGREMICLRSTTKHNLTIGDRVRLNGTNQDGEYRVYDLGNVLNEERDYFFVIEGAGSLIMGTNANFRKVINGYPCKYLKRKLSLIDIERPILVEPGFSTTIFNDKAMQVIYQDAVDLKDYKDYLGRPLAEVYLGVFKTKNAPDGGDFFTNLKSGFKVGYSEYVNKNSVYPNVNLINEITHNVSLDENILDFDDLILDLIEFDTFNYSETILTEVNYRFNTLNRQSSVNKTINDNGKVFDLGVRKEGYYYKPFHTIKLRETGLVEHYTMYDDIPNYAFPYAPDMYSVRRIIDKSKSTTVDLPFLNGVHYVEQRIIFPLKRQDPFGVMGLLHLNFPSDKVGKTNKRIKALKKPESSNDEC